VKMKALIITAMAVLLASIVGLTWRLAQQEQELRTLNALLAAKSSPQAAALIPATALPDGEVFTLYRSSPFSPDLRVHVGTFDSRSFDEPAQNKQYNFEICSDAQLNFNERNKGTESRFWCEEGRFREKLR
jgi:hypothetical protein